MAAHPKVNFYTQVSLETHARRLRLQKRTGYTLPRLIEEALSALERSLDEGMWGIDQSVSASE